MWSLIQDRDGYLWFGSYGGGVTRYNGNEFKKFLVNHGLAHNTVHALYEDRVGRLWFGTLGGGVCYWDGEQFYTFSERDGLPGNKVLSIVEDSQGLLWFGLSGLGMVYWDGKKFITPDFPKDILNTSVQSLFVDKNQFLWIGTNTGLYRYDGQRCEDLTAHLSFSSGSPRKTVLHIFQDCQDRLWFSCWEDGLRIFENGHFKSIPQLDILKGHLVWDILQDRDGTFWFAAGDLYQYEPGLGIVSKITPQQGLPSGELRGILEDLDGNLWMTTYGGGISKLGHTFFATLNASNDLFDSNITAICEDHQNLYWFGTANSGVVYMGVTINEKSGLSSNRISDIVCGPNQAMWIATTDGGINVYADQKILHKINTSNGLGTNRVNSLMVGDDHTIWAGTHGAGLCRINPETFVCETILPHITVIDTDQDAQGVLWLGSANGLIRYTSAQPPEIFSRADGLADDYITCVEVDLDNNVWIGTVNGVSYLERGALPPQLKPNLPEGRINFIQNDHSGYLWFGTPRGVDRYNPQTEVRVHFDVRSGLAGDETNPRACYLDQMGHPWFGTKTGVSYYLYENADIDSLPPPVYIESFQLFGQDYFNPAARVRSQKIRYRAESEHRLKDPGFFEKAGVKFATDQPLKLSYDQNYCGFEFIALNYLGPSSVLYRYSLKGLGENYIVDTDRPYATYPNLEPGSYTFQVWARRENGQYGDNPAEFSFIINAPWWKTIWFRILAIIMTGLIGTGLYLKRVQHFEQEKQIELSYQRDILERKRMQDELDQARLIQMSMLPRENPRLPGFEIVGMCSPANEVGGDYYDFIWSISREGESNEGLGIIIGDVAGHGMSSGLVVSMFKSSVYMFNQIIANPRPSQILTALNDMICQTSHKQLLMTCIYAYLDPKTRNLTLSNAGHPFPYHYKAADDQLEEVELIAFPLGIYGNEFTDKTIHLQINDVVLFYTDGIVESKNTRDEMFSFERLAEFLHENAQLTAAEILKSLMAEVQHFTENGHQVDDITLVVIKALGNHNSDHSHV